MTTIGVVGLGLMGSRIATRLLEAGHEVTVWNRSSDKTIPLAERGANAASTPAEVARSCELVLTMVADPTALVDVSEGPNGIAAGAAGAAGALTVIEMSTVGPEPIARLRASLPADVGLLDAPVLGSTSEVEKGTLKLFVGGPDELAQSWMSLLSQLGTPIHVGALGSGAAAKLVANSTLFGTLSVFAEALALADALGLERDKAFEVLAATPVGAQVERRRPSIDSDDYPKRFALSLARKDAQLVAGAARSLEVEMRVGEAARRWIENADDAGWGERDYSAMIRWILGNRD